MLETIFIIMPYDGGTLSSVVYDIREPTLRLANLVDACCPKLNKLCLLSSLMVI